MDVYNFKIVKKDLELPVNVMQSANQKLTVTFGRRALGVGDYWSGQKLESTVSYSLLDDITGKRAFFPNAEVGFGIPLSFE